MAPLVGYGSSDEEEDEVQSPEASPLVWTYTYLQERYSSFSRGLRLTKV